jgi:excisionase family DNA binding protein
MKNTTHDGRVSTRELAALLRVSTDTIRRAFRKGEISAIRVRTALRFDLDEVRLGMRRNAEARYGRNSGAPGGNRRPRAGATSPRTGNTGALPTGLVTGGLRIR